MQTIRTLNTCSSWGSAPDSDVACLPSPPILRTLFLRTPRGKEQPQTMTLPKQAQHRISETLAVVEDEPVQREVLAGSLEDEGYQVQTFPCAEDCWRALQHGECSPDLVITDLCMKDMSGIDLLGHIKELNPEIPVVVVSAFADVPQAVDAVRAGAFHFLTKPLELDAVHNLIHEALAKRRLEHEVDSLRSRLTEELGLKGLVGQSQHLTEVLTQANRVARTDVPVLLMGESGTGKNLLAKTIHLASLRGSGPLVTLNCSTLGEGVLESELFGHEKGSFTGAEETRPGYFEQAAEGTLLLDEVGEIPLHVQVKLLNVLQDRTFLRVGGSQPIPMQARILAATNKDLQQAVSEGTFREDLYYRLNVFTIQLPTLRERKADLPALIERLMETIADEYGLECPPLQRDAHDALLSYSFPGNVRELKNILARAMVMASGSPVTLNDLPVALRPTPEQGASLARNEPEDNSLPEQVTRLETRLIEEALDAHNRVKTRAAESLGISERLLRYKIKKYNLTPRPKDS